MMVKKVPVSPAHIPDVGLQNQQTTTLFQYTPNLAQGREQILLQGEMLEEVTGKRDIDGVVPERAQVCAGALQYLDSWSRVATYVVAQVDGDLPSALDMVDELAIAGPQIQHGVISTDISLQEASAQHSPDAIFTLPCLIRESVRVQPRNHELCASSSRMSSSEWVISHPG